MGLRRGDLVLSVSGTNLSSYSQMWKAYRKAKIILFFCYDPQRETNHDQSIHTNNDVDLQPHLLETDILCFLRKSDQVNYIMICRQTKEQDSDKGASEINSEEVDSFSEVTDRSDITTRLPVNNSLHEQEIFC